MRLFLAFDLEAAVRGELAAIQERLQASTTGWRFLAPSGIHLTLRFLGEVAPEADRPLRGVWRRTAAAFPGVRVRIAGSGVFPGPRHPRILWIGVHEEPPSGVLEALADALERAAREHGFAPSTRPFRPHLTLARSREGSAVAPVAAELGVLSSVWCREVVLFQSVLGRGGARYTALETFPLAGGAS